MIEYYCSRDTLLGINISNPPFSIYCGSVVNILHIFITALFFMIFFLILCLFMDGILFIINPKRELNRKIKQYFFNIIFRPRVIYSLETVENGNVKEIYLKVESNMFNGKFSLSLDFDEFRAYKNADADRNLQTQLLGIKPNLYKKVISGKDIFRVKVGEVRGDYLYVLLNGSKFYTSDKTEYIYSIYESGKYRGKVFKKLSKKFKINFLGNGKIMYE